MPELPPHADPPHTHLCPLVPFWGRLCLRLWLQELATLEEGLEEEAQALGELHAALQSVPTAKPKEAYVALKMALASAHQKSRGLRSDLAAAISAAEEALQACLVGNGMSPELARAALTKLKAEQDKYLDEHRRQSAEDLRAAGESFIPDEEEWEAHAERLAAEKLAAEAA